MKPILECHNNLHTADDLIDLRPNSNFVKQLSSEILIPYLKELDNMVESLIPSHVHDFLVKFFKEDLTGNDWQTKIDELHYPDQNDWLTISAVQNITSIVSILRGTLLIYYIFLFLIRMLLINL